MAAVGSNDGFEGKRLLPLYELQSLLTRAPASCQGSTASDFASVDLLALRRWRREMVARKTPATSIASSAATTRNSKRAVRACSGWAGAPCAAAAITFHIRPLYERQRCRRLPSSAYDHLVFRPTGKVLNQPANPEPSAAVKVDRKSALNGPGKLESVGQLSGICPSLNHSEAIADAFKRF